MRLFDLESLGFILCSSQMSASNLISVKSIVVEIWAKVLDQHLWHCYPKSRTTSMAKKYNMSRSKCSKVEVSSSIKLQFWGTLLSAVELIYVTFHRYRQKGEAVAALWDDVKDTVERWRLDSSLTICRLCYLTGLRFPPPTHPSTHLSARCSSQNIPHTSGPRVFPKRSLSYHSAP